MSGVDPVVHLLADLDHPARPAVEFQDALLARLLGELEDAIREPEAQATARSNGWGARVLRAVRRRPGRTMLACVAVAGAATAALFVDAPWTTSPGFLERAQAALTPPEGMILHARWEVTRTSRDFGCSFTAGPNELWADLTAPDRYRMIERQWPSPEAVDRRSMACDGHMTMEGGGSPRGSLRFVPPNTLTFNGPGLLGSKDEVAYLREALANGTAHDEGQTVLDGRVVTRLRLDCLELPCVTGPEYWYVDSETFQPVQFESHNAMHFNDRFGLLDFDVAARYLTYEYLPRTDANLALTDIRAQHPDATGP